MIEGMLMRDRLKDGAIPAAWRRGALFAAVVAAVLTVLCYRGLAMQNRPDVAPLMGEAYTEAEGKAFWDLYEKQVGEHTVGKLLYTPRVSGDFDIPVPVGETIYLSPDLEVGLEDEEFSVSEISVASVEELSWMCHLVYSNAADMGSRFYVISYRATEDDGSAYFGLILSDTGDLFFWAGGGYQDRGMYEME